MSNGSQGFILEPGIYWVDSTEVVQPDGSREFPVTVWRMENREHVKFRRVTPHLDERPPREWLLMEVTAPVLWTLEAAKGGGKPTPAPRGLDTVEEDTFSAPDVDAPSSFEIMDKIETALKAAGTAGMFFLAWVLYDTFVKRRS